MQREVPLGVAIVVIAVVVLLVVGVGWWYLNRSSPQNPPTPAQGVLPGSQPGQPTTPQGPKQVQPNL
ncbi:MAG: hypothetical protein OXFUSZZB_002051 [Candidatus Fervidibacter sp.]|jgi:negative regulator of sigma E activity